VQTTKVMHFGRVFECDQTCAPTGLTWPKELAASLASSSRRRLEAGSDPGARPTARRYVARSASRRPPQWVERGGIDIALLGQDRFERSHPELHVRHRARGYDRARGGRPRPVPEPRYGCCNLATAPPSRNGRRLAAAACGRVDATCDLSSRVFGLHAHPLLYRKARKEQLLARATLAAPIARRAASTAILADLCGFRIPDRAGSSLPETLASNPAERIKGDMPQDHTRDGTDIFYKDGVRSAIVFSHGCRSRRTIGTLRCLFFLGRASVWSPMTAGPWPLEPRGQRPCMDHYADDLAA